MPGWDAWMGCMDAMRWDVDAIAPRKGRQTEREKEQSTSRQAGRQTGMDAGLPIGLPFSLL